MKTQKFPDIHKYYEVDRYKAAKNKESLELRTRGCLPIVEIAGHPFFVDVRNALVQPWANFETMGINLNALEMHRQSRRLVFDYHVPSMTRVIIPQDVKELPADVVRIDMPNRYYLDPVGMAMMNGKEPDYYMGDGIRMRMYHVAKVIPLHKTEVLDLVQTNRKKEGLEQLILPKATARKLPKKNKGMRL